MSLFGSKFESYIGVDIGADGIKLVELKKTGGRPQLWTYGIADDSLAIHPAPDFSIERADHIADLLSALIKKSKVSGRLASSSLPVSHIFHTIINLPKVSEKEIDAVVRAEIGKVLPLPADQMQIVHQTVPLPESAGKNFIRLLVTAAPKTMVEFYTRIFQKAGIQLRELETEAFALSRSLVGKDDSLSMLVDIGAERTNFSLIDKGLPMTQRSLHMGGDLLDSVIAERLGISAGEARLIKRDISVNPVASILPENFLRFLEPLAKEIQHHFDLYVSQSGNEGRIPEKIVLTGGSAFFPPVLEYLRSQFQLRVFIGDPWARVIYQDGLKPILNEIAPRMAVAIGLALRHF